ncbi:hypothetical protein [Nitrosomonas sp.]|uniref:hypothetical protein n=1 Tax=Nitrosomonas sp. TaxID=42353 RepID=UPI00284516A0|nr:hypothetical protein [Nitrosomonas sp.]MCP5243778.1 hypothetical protein [Burkholderiales bacterium]MCP5292852.1 hypothetical protein [Burkholderiales bacterium]MDR4515080.1 hypothetical protein [Nitrosomonas sp.]
MSTTTEAFQDKTIEIQDNTMLFIDGKPIQVVFDNETGKWSTHLIPYKEFDDLLTLAKQIIADSEEFK